MLKHELSLLTFICIEVDGGEIEETRIQAVGLRSRKCAISEKPIESELESGRFNN